jgi:hypothetical protein
LNRRFLIAPPWTEALPFRKFLEELQLPHGISVSLAVLLSFLSEDRVGRQVADQLTNFGRQGIAVVGWRCECCETSLKSAFHKG